LGFLIEYFLRESVNGRLVLFGGVICARVVRVAPGPPFFLEIWSHTRCEFVTVTDAAVLSTHGFSALINAPDTRVCCISRCALAEGHLTNLEVKPGSGEVVVLPQIAEFAKEHFGYDLATA